MEGKLNPSFKKVKAACYTEHKHGFYVYTKPNKCDPKAVIKYIGRYLGRPVMATSRIDKYDGEFVTFHYNRHEGEKYIANPPEGMTAKNIRCMSDGDLLNMDYFLNDDNPNDDFDGEGF